MAPMAPLGSNATGHSVTANVDAPVYTTQLMLLISWWFGGSLFISDGELRINPACGRPVGSDQQLMQNCSGLNPEGSKYCTFHTTSATYALAMDAATGRLTTQSLTARQDPASGKVSADGLCSRFRVKRVFHSALSRLPAHEIYTACEDMTAEYKVTFAGGCVPTQLVSLPQDCGSAHGPYFQVHKPIDPAAEQSLFNVEGSRLSLSLGVICEKWRACHSCSPRPTWRQSYPLMWIPQPIRCAHSSVTTLSTDTNFTQSVKLTAATSSPTARHPTADSERSA